METNTELKQTQTDKCIKEQKEYVKRYAKQHGITVKQALEHEIVKNVINWMKLRDNEKQNVKSGKVR